MVVKAGTEAVIREMFWRYGQLYLVTFDIGGNWEQVYVEESLAFSSGDDLERSLGGFESFVVSEAF